MLLSRILGGLGRFFISLGVLTLLFVAYQLWGTGIMTAQAQNALENDFEDLLAEAEAPVDPALEDTDLAVSSPETDETDETTEADQSPEPVDAGPTRAELRRTARLLWQPDGKPVAQIFAPDIDLDWTVVAGVTSDALTNGPGHYTSTPMPGQPGNASIAGHRTTWGAPFNRIDELDPGDEITVRTVQGTFVYRVVEQDNGLGYFIVTPDRVDVLDQDFTEHPNRLTLTACHPKFSAAQRIIVVAELVGEPAPFIGPPGGGGLGESVLASEDVGGDNAQAPDAEAAGDDGSDGAGDADATTDADAGGTDPDGSGQDEAAEEAVEDTGTEQAPDTEDTVVAAAAPTGDRGDPTGALTTSEDFGEGLNGDSSAILPSITWGIAALAIWATAAFAAARWRRIPAYAFGVVPFFGVLFICFMHIDQAIPSY
ncbi:MAG: class E sortase [Acidimicrobiales bacterium]